MELTVEQRIEVYKAIIVSFEEERGKSYEARVLGWRTGYNEYPFFIYGCGICLRVNFFSNELFGQQLEIVNFPELVQLHPTNQSIHATWFKPQDIESRIKVLNKAIELCQSQITHTK